MTGVGVRAEVDTRDLLHLAGKVIAAAGIAAAIAGTAGAEALAQTVRVTIPKRTGALAGSIVVRSVERGAQFQMGNGAVLYASWVEYGRSGTARRKIRKGRYVGPARVAAQAVHARVADETMSRETAKI